MLGQLSLFHNGLVEVAIKRIQLFAGQALANHPNGYVLCDSGGKDSDIIKELAYRSGVPFEIIHNHTTADHPLTVRYVRQERERWQALGIPYTINYPTYKGERVSMWSMIPLKGPPTRRFRWCCEIFKEHGTDNRFAITGVRWDESPKRKKSRGAYEVFETKRRRVILNNDNDASRMMTERCMSKGQFILNPTIDWENAAVWNFINANTYSYNPLYDMGYLRVGCVGCPMSYRRGIELEKNPAFKKLYIRAFQRFIDRRNPVKDTDFITWQSGEDVYKWWINNTNLRIDRQQTRIETYLESLAG